MGIIKKQAIPAAIVLYLGVALGYVNLVVLFPLALDPAQIGLLRFLMNTAMLIVPFAQLGMSNILIRFHPYFEDETAHRKFLFMAFGLPFVSFLLLFTLLFLFKAPLLALFENKSPLILEYYPVLLPLTFIMMYSGIVTSYSRTMMKVVYPNFFREFVSRLLVMVSILIFLKHLISFSQLVLLYVSSYAMVLLLLLNYTHRVKRYRFSISRSLIPVKQRKEIISFSLFSILASASSILVGTIDTIMLSAMAGLEKTGIYSVAFFIGLAIELPRRSIYQITSPLVAKAWANHDMVMLQKLYHKTSINQMIVGTLLFIGVWCNVDNIFALIPNGTIYAQGKYVVLFIGLGKLINMAAGNNSDLITNSKYFRFNFYSVGLLALLTVITNLIFIPVWGLTGAALASAFSLFIFNLSKFLFLLIKTGLQPFGFSAFKLILLGSITFLAGYYFPFMDSILLDIAIRYALIILTFIPGIYYWKVSEDINASIDHVLGKIGLK